jgi:predicted RNA-binding Zn-ribbon protein involved in translation (DUF1610 family)
MITPQELRYGNKLLFLNEIVTFKNIAEFRDDGTFWINFIEKITPQKNFQFKPIPLTEEWLLKFGFEINRQTKEENNIWKRNWEEGCFEVEQIGTGFYLWDNYCYGTKIKYVHQIQNLYFALTGEELTSKTTVMEEERCPNCGECENIHTNFDWRQKHRPVEEYLCNECGTYFKPKQEQ